MKLYFWDGRWRLASNRHLDVDCLDGKYACTGRSNRQLFDEAAKASQLDYARLDPRCIYLFERCHPDFKIVVSFDAPALFHLGTRDMHNLAEIQHDIGVARPREWRVQSLAACHDILAAHADIGEGLVLREAYLRAGAAGLRRQKLKRPEYVWLHDCSCGGARGIFDFSWVARTQIDRLERDRACLNVYLRQEEEEFAAYYPDLTKRFNKVSAALEGLQRAGVLDGADPRQKQGGQFVHEAKLWQALSGVLTV